jgi:peptidoglycan/xylan/chitin deacetylase (PgdA/CDA1 family)
VRVVPLDVIRALADDDDAVAITFDDGLESFGRSPRRCCVSTGCRSRCSSSPTPWVDATSGAAARRGHPRCALLDWDAARWPRRLGVALGAHTCTHLNLASADADSAQREIVSSKTRLARELGVDVTTFAYPYGGVSMAARDVVAREFRFGVSTRLAALSPHDDPARLPRLDSYYFRGAGTLEAWGTTRFRMRLALRAGARSVRGSLTRSLAR